MRRLFSQAWRMARRERHAGEHRLSQFSLLVGISAIMALALVTSRVEQAMFSQAADLIGGDLVLNSSQPIDPQLLESAKALGLGSSKATSLMSMVNAADGRGNGNYQLSRIRAVDGNYPLKGSLTVRDDRNAPDTLTRSRPSPGETWVDKRLLDKLAIAVNDVIEVGYGRFKVTKIIVSEPDAGGSFYRFNPRVMINQHDLAVTKLIQPGSVSWQKLMLSGDVKPLQQWRADAVASLQTGQRLTTPRDRSSQLSANLERASALINLGSLLAVILCSLAVSLATARFAARHISQVAVLRCLGYRSSEVNVIYILQLLFIAIPATILAVIIGYGLHLGLVVIVDEFFSTTLPAASWKAWFSGPLTALCMLLGFGLPPILRLAATPPVQVLRAPQGNVAYSWWQPMAAFVALLLIAWWQTGNFKLSLTVVVALVLVLLILMLVMWLLLKLASKRNINQADLRHGLRNLAARPLLSALQIAGFAVAVFAVALIIHFQHDLLGGWQKNIAKDTSNRFVFDITSAEVDDFRQRLQQQDVDATLYPVTRGRLLTINDQTVQDDVTKEDDEQRNVEDRALNRELALTETQELPTDNVIVDGVWHQAATRPDHVAVSVESQLADRLDLKLGDSLGFAIEGRQLLGQITSIRKVDWENFKPNFYMVFEPPALSSFSQTWLTSFHLAAADRQFEQQLAADFSAINIINVDDIIARILRIIEQVSAALALILLMTGLAAVAVFWAALVLNAGARQQQVALLRALGASAKQVRRRFLLEQGLLGFFAGLLAVLCLLLVTYDISHRLLSFEWSVPWLLCLVIPPLLGAMVMALAAIQLRQLMSTPPLEVLQRPQAA